jgi:hypothetical protein
MTQETKCKTCGRVFVGLDSRPVHLKSTNVFSEYCYKKLFVPGITPAEDSDKGLRYNEGKSRVDLIPPDALLEVGKIYTYGANKYAPHNWEKGMNYSDMYASLQRHLLQFWDGETLDPESNQHHLTSVAFGVLGLLHFELNRDVYEQFDDRVKRSPNGTTFWAEANLVPIPEGYYMLQQDEGIIVGDIIWDDDISGWQFVDMAMVGMYARNINVPVIRKNNE